MSEEIATVDANLREIARLRAALEREKENFQILRGGYNRIRQERDRAELERDRLAAAMRQEDDEHAALLAELAAAHERERIAAEAYHGQQQSYRDLEALYQAMTERAQAAEAELARRRQAAHLNEK